jgi:hypothetical protein
VGQLLNFLWEFYLYIIIIIFFLKPLPILYVPYIPLDNTHALQLFHAWIS